MHIVLALQVALCSTFKLNMDQNYGLPFYPHYIEPERYAKSSVLPKYCIIRDKNHVIEVPLTTVQLERNTIF